MLVGGSLLIASTKPAEFLAVGSSGAAAISRDGGRTWAAVAIPPGSWYSVAYGRGTIIVTGDTSIARSTDGGLTWTTLNTVYGVDVTYSGGTFVTIPQNIGQSAHYSTDGGVTWTAAAFPFANGSSTGSVAGGAGVFAATHNNTAGQPGGIKYSLDGGATWTQATIPNAAGFSGLGGIAYGNGAFIAVCDGATLRSTDGINWTQGTSYPSNGYAGSIEYGEGRFVVATLQYSAGAYSTDNGSTWTSTNLGSAPNWSTVGYSNGVFVVLSGSTVGAYSTDGGVTWSHATLPAQYGYYRVAGISG